VRAGLVAKAESWRWSSAAAHCGSLEPDTGLAMEMWNKRWSMETWREYLAAGETECEISRRFVSARTQAARWARRNSCTRWSKRRSAAWWRKRVGVQGMPSTIGHKLCWHSRNSLDSHGPGNFPRKRKRPVCPRFVAKGWASGACHRPSGTSDAGIQGIVMIRPGSGNLPSERKRPVCPRFVRVLSASNPISILLGFANVFRSQIGDAATAAVAYRGAQDACYVENGLPIPAGY